MVHLTVEQKGIQLVLMRAIQMVLMSESCSVRLLEICLVPPTEMLKVLSSGYLSAELKAMKMVLMMEMSWVLQTVKSLEQMTVMPKETS